MSKATLLSLGVLLSACTPIHPDDDDVEFRGGNPVNVYVVVPTSPPFFSGRATIHEVGGLEVAIVLDNTGAMGPVRAECDVSHLSCSRNDPWECEVPEAALTFSGELCVGEDYWGAVQQDGKDEKPHLLSLQTKQQLQSW